MKNGKIGLSELNRRYRHLYTGVVADILDSKGVRNHSLPPSIRPLKDHMKVAGPAFTCLGVQTGDMKSDDTPMLIKMLEAITPYSVIVLSASGDRSSSHWGEIMTLSAKQRGSTGRGRRAEGCPLHSETELPGLHRFLHAGQLHQPLGAERVPGGYEGRRGFGLPGRLCLRRYGWSGHHSPSPDRRGTGGVGKSGAAGTKNAPSPAPGNAAK